MAEHREPIFMCQPEELDMMRLAADEYGRRGQFAEMEGVLDGLALMEPNDPWIYSALGYARHRQNKLDLAVEAYQRALELSDGNDTISAVNLVAVFIMLGRGDDAIAMLERVVASNDRRPQIKRAIERLELALSH